MNIRIRLYANKLSSFSFLYSSMKWFVVTAFLASFIPFLLLAMFTYTSFIFGSTVSDYYEFFLFLGTTGSLSEWKEFSTSFMAVYLIIAAVVIAYRILNSSTAKKASNFIELWVEYKTGRILGFFNKEWGNDKDKTLATLMALPTAILILFVFSFSREERVHHTQNMLIKTEIPSYAAIVTLDGHFSGEANVQKLSKNSFKVTFFSDKKIQTETK